MNIKATLGWLFISLSLLNYLIKLVKLTPQQKRVNNMTDLNKRAEMFLSRSFEDLLQGMRFTKVFIDSEAGKMLSRASSEFLRTKKISSSDYEGLSLEIDEVIEKMDEIVDIENTFDVTTGDVNELILDSNFITAYAVNMQLIRLVAYQLLYDSIMLN